MIVIPSYSWEKLYTVERVFFVPIIFSRFSENEVFAQCNFHDFRFICSLSLVMIHFRAVLFSRFFPNREKRENITGAKKPVLQYSNTFLNPYFPFYIANIFKNG